MLYITFKVLYTNVRGMCVASLSQETKKKTFLSFGVKLPLTEAESKNGK